MIVVRGIWVHMVFYGLRTVSETNFLMVFMAGCGVFFDTGFERVMAFFGFFFCCGVWVGFLLCMSVFCLWYGVVIHGGCFFGRG